MNDAPVETDVHLVPTGDALPTGAGEPRSADVTGDVQCGFRRDGEAASGIAA